ncbi:hypothetical protein LY78DRAFT_645275 [Colletotrichum sublineola]|nr:hypothetical protein LY78DRAFT_645275 [Colletotrichum sublineola]
MKLLKSIPKHTREARVLYLTCLACIVLLLGLLSYNVWLNSDIYTPSLLGSAADTATHQNGPNNGASSSMQNEPDLSGLKYSFIMPTYAGDIPLAIEFLQSFMCLCTDYREIKIHVIVSDSSEYKMFQTALDNLVSCGERFSIFPVPQGNVGGPRPNIEIINLFDILPPVFHMLTNGNITANDTSALLRERGKYQYQTIKKMAAAAALDYDWALWMDSESIVVQPFSARRMFDGFARAPTIWRSSLANTPIMHSLMNNSASVLRLPAGAFGPDLWNLESQEWIIEKPVLDDLIQYVEKAHDQDFWATWAANGGPFEVTLYNLYVHWRKLETTDPMYGKYRIMDTEMEMSKFGVLSPSTQEIKATMSGTGLLERSYKLLKVPGTPLKLSNMLQAYGMHIYRLDMVEGMVPEEIDRLLLDTPINMLCSAVPPLHKWWKERNVVIGEVSAA